MDNAAGWKDTIGICGGTSVITAEDFVQELLAIGHSGGRRGIAENDISARLR